KRFTNVAEDHGAHREELSDGIEATDLHAMPSGLTFIGLIFLNAESCSLAHTRPQRIKNSRQPYSGFLQLLFNDWPCGIYVGLIDLNVLLGDLVLKTIIGTVLKTVRTGELLR